jgi:hypothetical protein
MKRHISFSVGLWTLAFALITPMALAQTADGETPVTAGGPQPPDPSAATANLQDLGLSPQPATFSVPDGQRVVSSDIAFQGKFAFQGNYNGFRVLDISSPANPTLIAQPECNGDQGDLVVWDHILIRSWNTKRSTSRTCGDTVVSAGFEGIHVWDISNPANPVVVAALELPCGSHTLTAAGVDGNELIVYSNNSSSGGCGVGLDRNGQDLLGDFMDIIAVPLDDPASVYLTHREPLAGPTDTLVRTGCHDAGVILGDINRAACASADTINVWDIEDPRDPDLMFTITEPGVGSSASNGRWHSAAFTWDGAVLVAGWEPGGGGAGECEATDPDIDKSLFFYNGKTGAKLGQWVLPRAQGADENCTLHNFNVIPIKKEGYVLSSGNYQAGTWVVDFTDPDNATAVAWSDPVSLGPGPFCGGQCEIGGAWSTYWYNGLIYESDITRGLQVYLLSHPARGGAMRLQRLNPQTNEFNFGPQ